MRLEHGFDRLDAFCAVQGADVNLHAVKLLQEAVGIDDADRALLLERLPRVSGQAHSGSVLLGVILGLFAAGDS